MNKESLGKLVVNDGKVYEVIGYVEDPCFILKERATGIEKTVVIGSRESMNYIDIKDYIAALNWTIEENKKGSDKDVSSKEL